MYLIFLTKGLFIPNHIYYKIKFKCFVSIVSTSLNLSQHHPDCLSAVGLEILEVKYFKHFGGNSIFLSGFFKKFSQRRLRIATKQRKTSIIDPIQICIQKQFQVCFKHFGGISVSLSEFFKKICQKRLRIATQNVYSRHKCAYKRSFKAVSRSLVIHSYITKVLHCTQYNGAVVRVLNSQYRDLGFDTIWWKDLFLATHNL